MQAHLFIFHKQRGISLLELILSISLIAIVLVGGMQYFQVARQASKVSEALLILKTIYSAAELWRFNGLQFDQSSSPDHSPTDPLLIKFARLGLLDAQYAALKYHPWGGSLEVNGSLNTINIQLLELPTKACESIKSKVEFNFALKEISCVQMADNSTFSLSVEIK